MKTMWCWRCKTEMPMLDEEEFAIVADLYQKAFSATPEFCQEYHLADRSIDERFRPMREKYYELTGFEEKNENAIMHHRLSLYGEPCERCGKPLRTPRASFCAACGKTIEK